jgi:hypothetical protein
MRLGFTIKPDISVERIVALTRSAEAAGFEYGWMFDSHRWARRYYHGKSVRDTGSDLRRPGGDRSRAGRPLAPRDSKQPTTFSQLEPFVGIFRDLTAARDERQRRAGVRRLRHRNSSAAPSLSVSILPPLSGPRARIRGSF